MINPVLAAVAHARQRAAPLFARWCELNGASFCPAAPQTVARFVNDCSALGIERLWPAIQEVSKLHISLGLADPTLGAPAAAAVGDVAGITPPRSWPNEYKQRFRSLPYDVQLFVAAHETQRDRALRRSQNEAAAARQRLAASGQPSTKLAEGTDKHEDTTRADT
jgi:hypothetical protein